MKTIATAILFFILSASAWGSECWIQVYSGKTAIDPGSALFKRLKASGHSFESVSEGGLQKVRLGAYENCDAARKVLGSVRCTVASDAFIVSSAATMPRVESVPENLAVVSGGSSAVVADAKPVAPAASEPEKATPPETSSAKPAAAAPCTCICDRHALRKAEIDDAISYYRNSPHYRFETLEQGWSEK